MDLGLEAVARLVHRQVPVALTMIGEGPEESRWRARAEQLGVAQHVSWLRWLPQAELAAHYRAHDALLFPSLHDSGGFVVLEALAQGLPVVCLALGGPGQMVTADCGEAIDTTELNVETCADALASALERVHRHPARDTLRAEAVARAREFDWQHVVGRAMSVVESALRAPGSDSPP
jgi:glycosyltransferase involved in cell wall biosynthesis